MSDKAELKAEDKPAPEGHDESMATKFDQQVDGGGESTGSKDSSTKETNEPKPESKEGGDEKSSEKPTEETGDKGEEKAPSSEDFDRFRQEFSEKGELSDESYKELQDKYNLPKEVVDSYAREQQAAAKAVETAGMAVAGGKEQFGQMAQWAKQNLPEAEVKEFNDQVNSGDVGRAVEAVTNLKTKYSNSVGEEPNLIDGSATSDTAPGYRSRAEMTADINDARYKKDPAFRAEVERKLKNSNVF